jgi:hypothetical protein
MEPRLCSKGRGGRKLVWLKKILEGLGQPYIKDIIMNNVDRMEDKLFEVNHNMLDIL